MFECVTWCIWSACCRSNKVFRIHVSLTCRSSAEYNIFLNEELRQCRDWQSERSLNGIQYFAILIQEFDFSIIVLVKFVSCTSSIIYINSQLSEIFIVLVKYNSYVRHFRCSAISVNAINFYCIFCFSYINICFPQNQCVTSQIFEHRSKRVILFVVCCGCRDFKVLSRQSRYTAQALGWFNVSRRRCYLTIQCYIMNCNREVSSSNVVSQLANLEAKTVNVSNAPTYNSSFIDFYVSIIHILRIVEFHSQQFADSSRRYLRVILIGCRVNSFVIELYRFGCQINVFIEFKWKIVQCSKSISFLQSVCNSFIVNCEFSFVISFFFICFTLVGRERHSPQTIARNSSCQ